MSSSNCCFLTYIQISQEAGQTSLKLWIPSRSRTLTEKTFSCLDLHLMMPLFSSRTKLVDLLLASLFCPDGLPGGSVGKNSAYNAEDHAQHRRPGLNPWVGKIPWRREWQPLQHSCLGNPMDTGAWRATAHGVGKELVVTGRLRHRRCSVLPVYSHILALLLSTVALQFTFAVPVKTQHFCVYVFVNQ